MPLHATAKDPQLHHLSPQFNSVCVCAYVMSTLLMCLRLNKLASCQTEKKKNLCWLRRSASQIFVSPSELLTQGCFRCEGYPGLIPLPPKFLIFGNIYWVITRFMDLTSFSPVSHHQALYEFFSARWKAGTCRRDRKPPWVGLGTDPDFFQLPKSVSDRPTDPGQGFLVHSASAWIFFRPFRGSHAPVNDFSFFVRTGV